MRDYQPLQDVDGEEFKWSSPSRSRLHDFATKDRYRFARMFGGLVLIIALAVFSISAVGWSGRDAPLRFTSSGTFQISIFEDLHFGENAWDQWGPQQDIWSIKVMNSILDVESQQLAVLNGDLITGENTYLENSTNYVDQIVAPLVEHGVSWASTYGNHDSQYNLSPEALLNHERQYPNARTTQMVFNSNSGVTNYYLPVYPADKRKHSPCLILWFFDSRGGVEPQQLDSSGNQIHQPDWVHQSVVNWFIKTHEELKHKHGKVIPSLAFVHIPTDASRALQTEAGVDPHHQPGINDDNPLARQAQEGCPDGSDSNCDYGGQDIPFMRAITSTPGLIALFSGHDHGDTWCYKWDTQLPGMIVKGNGINLCFGQHSGYGGYGTWTRGSRQIFLSENMLENLEIDTWIRLENAEIVGSVTLNSSYNHDWYPATGNTHTGCPTCDYSHVR